MTNNIFQLDRFGKLIVRNLKRSPKSWTLSAIVLAGLPLLLFLFNVANIGLNSSLNGRASLLQLIMTFAFTFAPFLFFYNYNHPKKGLPEVMLPASALEKYIVMQLACIVFAPLTVFILYGSMDSLLAFIFPKIFNGYAVRETLRNLTDWESILKSFITLQAILFCNLLFVRRKVLKTFGAFILSMIVFAAILGIGVAIWNSQTPFTDVNDISLNFGNKGLFEMHVNDHPLVITMQVARILISVVLPILLIIGSYRLLKTKKY